MSQPKASVIILAWNGMGYLESCLDAVLAQDYPDFDVLVVDNGSTDGSPDFVAKQYPQVNLIRNENNLGYSAGNNIGLLRATGEVLVLLNRQMRSILRRFARAAIGTRCWKIGGDTDLPIAERAGA